MGPAMSTSGPTRRSTAAFVVVAAVWGTTPFTIKTGLNAGWQPLWFCGLRLLLAAVVVSPVLLTRFSGPPLGRRGRLTVVPMGVFGIAFNFGVTVWGQQYVGAALASLIAGTQPVMTTLFARYVTHRAITARFAASLVLGLGGLAVVFGGDAGASGVGLLGALAVFAGCTVYAAIFVYIGERVGDLNTVRVVATQNVIGGVLVASAALLFEGVPQLPDSAHAFVALAYLSVISSLVALILAVRLIGTLGASRFSLMSFVTPIIGVTVSVIWLHESLDLSMVCGALLVAVALGLSLRPSSGTAPRVVSAARATAARSDETASGTGADGGSRGRSPPAPGCVNAFGCGRRRPSRGLSHVDGVNPCRRDTDEVY